MIPILILAAGASTRMRGRDKLLEPVDGLPLLRQRVIAALGASSQVFVTIPSPDHPRCATVGNLGVVMLPVPDAGTGMAASLRIGVAALPKCNYFMVLLADLPEITSADMTNLMRQTDPVHQIWRGTDADGTPGHPIVFQETLRPLFASLTGDSGGREIIAAHKTKLIPLPGHHASRDLDTPGDWAAWRAQTNR